MVSLKWKNNVVKESNHFGYGHSAFRKVSFVMISE